MKTFNNNPEIVETPNGILIAYEFKIPPIDHDGSFHVGKLGLHYRTIVYQFDTDVYSFIDKRELDPVEAPNLLHFKVIEKPLDNNAKHVMIKFGQTTFEIAGNYVFNSFECKKSDVDFISMSSKKEDPTVNLF